MGRCEAAAGAAATAFLRARAPRNLTTLSPPTAPARPAPLCAQPLLDADAAVQAFFPARKYALLIPAAALAGAVALVGAFIGLVLLRSSAKAPAAAAPAPAKKAAASARKAK